ncbi:MAG: Asp23/Gls24 family envelope stress response protein [Rubrobacter sp.]|nr:Asp23/Gls24 family envelope stress response protein [Rubrobacter sp.]
MGTQRSSGGDNPLQTDRGNTIIQDAVVKSIVGVAAEEVEGIQTTTGGGRLPGDTSRTVGEFLGGLSGGGDVRTRGVSVEVGEAEAAADLTVKALYGKPIPQTTQAVRDNVVRRVESLTGLKVTEVNVDVADIYFPDEQVH